MSKFDKEKVGGMIFASLATLFVIGLGVLGYNIFHKDNISSPVEEMYHKQLVVTLDSILDARFSNNTSKEVIDSDNINPTYNKIDNIIAPME